MATAGAVGWPSWAQLEGPSWAWSSGGQDGIFTPAVLPPALLCYCCPGPGTPDHQLSSPVCLAAPFWGGGAVADGRRLVIWIVCCPGRTCGVREPRAVHLLHGLRP